MQWNLPMHPWLVCSYWHSHPATCTPPLQIFQWAWAATCFFMYTLLQRGKKTFNTECISLWCPCWNLHKNKTWSTMPYLKNGLSYQDLSPSIKFLDFVKVSNCHSFWRTVCHSFGWTVYHEAFITLPKEVDVYTIWKITTGKLLKKD